MPEGEQEGILSHCHDSACGGHFASQKMAMKVLQAGFYWPSLFKDAYYHVQTMRQMSKVGKNLSSLHDAIEPYSGC